MDTIFCVDGRAVPSDLILYFILLATHKPNFQLNFLYLRKLESSFLPLKLLLGI